MDPLAKVRAGLAFVRRRYVTRRRDRSPHWYGNGGSLPPASPFYNDTGEPIRVYTVKDL